MPKATNREIVVPVVCLPILLGMADQPLACPACAEPFLPEDVNVGANVAFCRTCSKAHVLSAVAGAPAAPPIVVFANPEQERLSRLVAEVDTTQPPDGAWVRDNGVETEVGASLRTIGGAIVMLGISLFWNGIVSVFVLLAIAGSLHLMGVGLPSWFPAPIMKGSGGTAMPLGMVLFLWVFLTPFILIGLVLIATFLTALAGHVKVTIRDDQGRVFTGIGSIGWTRKFDASQVKRVDILDSVHTTVNEKPVNRGEIVIDADKSIKFGASLKEPRKVFVAGALRKVLVG